MKRRAAAWGLCLLLGTTAARAGGATYWVDWSSPPSCPPVSRLHAEVQTRSSALRVEPEGAQVRIEVLQDASGYYLARASLPSGSLRTVKALGCEDVVSALAFIVVMELDAAVRERSLEEASLGEALPLSSATLQSEARVEAASAEWHGYAGVTGGAVGGRTPALMPMGGLFFELWREGPFLARGARVSASVGAGQLANEPNLVSLRFAGTSLEVCPIGIAFASACGGLDLGATQVRSGQALSNDHTLRLSLAGRAGLSLRKVFAETWLGEIGAGALLPITLDEFVLQRRDGTFQTLHTVAVSGYASVSIGYRL